MADNVFILAILCGVIILSEFLVRKTFLKHAGTALLVILVTAIFSNLGIIPTTSSSENPVILYDIIFQYIAPLSILWLLLKVNIKDILDAGLPLISLFVIGSIGTAIGVIIGMEVINGPESIGPNFHAIGGMFTGTYTGGSVNFNAVALHYDMMKEGVLFTGTVVVDNIITTFWMVATIAFPTLLAGIWRNKRVEFHTSKEVDLGIGEDTEAIHPLDLGITLFIGLSSLWLAEWMAEWTVTIGFPIPSIIVLTIIALIIAQFPITSKLKGSRLLGLFAVYLFLSVIGAYCDFGALGSIGSLGLSLLTFAFITVIFHGLFLFGISWLLKMDLDLTAIASQANIGGGTTALALARSIGRSDLVLPAVLIGSLGNALGTFLGFWVAGYLQ